MGIHLTNGTARVCVDSADAHWGLLKLLKPCIDSSVAIEFHQSDYRMAEPAQLIGLAAVAAAIIGDFLAAPPAISFGFSVSAWAAVPKAAADEDCDVVVGEHEVRSPGQTCSSCCVPDSHLTHNSPYA